MHTPSVPTSPSRTPPLQIVGSDPLPRWEDLPLEQQRELVMILARLVIKRLPSQGLTGGGRSDD
jgi:hypothetical protein